MPRTEETLQLQAKNNHVQMRTEGGERLVTCEDCREEWVAPTGSKGWPTRIWFLCPNLCNLSQRLAGRFLDEMEKGQREPDEALADRCRDRLLQVRRNERKKTIEHYPLDPLNHLADYVERQGDWHRRHSEWDEDLEEELRNFG